MTISSVFNGRACLQAFQFTAPLSCGSKAVSAVEEERVRVHLAHLSVHKSINSDGHAPLSTKGAG